MGDATGTVDTMTMPGARRERLLYGSHFGDFGMRMLLLALLAALTLGAQTPALHLDMAGEWRIQTGDNPDFARMDFDDRAWMVKRLPWRGLRPRPMWWLRREVAVPEWADLSTLVLTLGGMNEVYEVFVNGTRIAAVGKHSIFQEAIARPRSFPIPAGVISSGNRRCVIALRLWRSGWGTGPTRNPENDAGPYLLTSTINAPADAGAASMLRRERAGLPGILAMTVDATLALLLTLGFLLQRERKDLLLLAGLLAAEAFTNAGDFVSVANDLTHGAAMIFPVGRSLRALLLAYFAASCLGVESRWFRMAAWVPLLYHLFRQAQIAAAGTVTESRIISNRYLAMALLASIALLAGQSLYQAVRRKAWQEATLPLGILLFAGLNVFRYDILPLAQAQLEWAGMLIYPENFVLTAVALMVTVHLLRDFGAARQRLTGELEAARAVQQLLLPVGRVAGSEFEIDAEYRPAQEVGGDFYQVLVRDNSARMVLVGDVSGKGLKAAMMVSVVTGILRNEKSGSPGAVLAALNDGLAGHTGGGFVTCCCARFDADGSVTIANAGHLSPYCDGHEVAVQAELPLGIAAGVAYEESVVRGGSFTFVSDGVVEAENARRELFGFERTREISMKPARQIAEAAKAWGQTDDITVVTVRRSYA